MLLCCYRTELSHSFVPLSLRDSAEGGLLLMRVEHGEHAPMQQAGTSLGVVVLLYSLPTLYTINKLNVVYIFLSFLLLGMI